MTDDAAAETPGEDDAVALDRLLAAVRPPREPMDAAMADGYLCGVLLQTRPVPAARWLPLIVDTAGAPLPPGADFRPLQDLLQKRHAELDASIAARRWFDPWIFATDDDGADVSAVEPWVDGFAAAMERFPRLIDSDAPELTHPLALIFRHLDPAELEDADALLAEIEELEPPADLATAVEELVRAVLLLADVSRPQKPAAPAPRRAPPRRRTPPRR